MTPLLFCPFLPGTISGDECQRSGWRNCFIKGRLIVKLLENEWQICLTIWQNGAMGLRLKY